MKIAVNTNTGNGKDNETVKSSSQMNAEYILFLKYPEAKKTAREKEDKCTENRQIFYFNQGYGCQMRESYILQTDYIYYTTLNQRTQKEHLTWTQGNL